MRNFQKVTLLYGEPVAGLAELRDELRAQNASPVGCFRRETEGQKLLFLQREIRKALCDVVQNETYKLQERANALHEQWLTEK